MSFLYKIVASFGNFLIKAGAPINATIERSGQDLLRESAEIVPSNCACRNNSRKFLGESLMCLNTKFSAAPSEVCNLWTRFTTRDMTVAELGGVFRTGLFAGVAFQIGKFTGRGGVLGAGPIGDNPEEVYTIKEWKEWRQHYDERHAPKK